MFTTELTPTIMGVDEETKLKDVDSLSNENSIQGHSNNSGSSLPSPTTAVVLSDMMTTMLILDSQDFVHNHLPQNMRANNQLYSHESQLGDEPSHNKYTFETKPPHPHDEYYVWSPQTIIYPMNLNVQTTMHQSRSSAPISYSDRDCVDDNTHNPTNVDEGSLESPYLVHTKEPSRPVNVSLIDTDQSWSPLYPSSTGLPSPSTPSSNAQSFAPSPTMSDMNNMLVLDSQHHVGNPEKPRYTHREQLAKFKEVMAFPMDGAGPFIPQLMYKPHTPSDRKRYVEEVMLEGPLYFISEHPKQYGISLRDALHSRTKRLRDRDQIVFEGRGPSVSIRLEWPGYRQWSRQIPTKDFRSPPQPITLAKLAKNVAKCVQRFMLDRKAMPMEEDCDSRWKIGDGADDIKLDDLVLVSIHHVSLGSWQPQLRLIRPLRQRASRVSVPAHSLVTPPNGSPSGLTPYSYFS